MKSGPEPWVAIDRRFNCTRQDRQQAIDTFSAGLRDEVDLDRLSGSLRSAVGSALEPSEIGLWRRR